eukprot:scpid107238/ scgid29949/ 
MADSRELAQARKLIDRSIPEYVACLLQTFGAVQQQLVGEVRRLEEHISKIKAVIKENIKEIDNEYQAKLRLTKRVLERANREATHVIQSIVFLADDTLSTSAFDKNLGDFIGDKTPTEKNLLQKYCTRVN